MLRAARSKPHRASSLMLGDKRITMSKDPIIPGAKFIEQGLAALPSHARLEVENRDLRSKLELAEKKIAELEAKVVSLQPTHGVHVEAGQVLKQFAEHGPELSADQVADIAGISRARVIHHFGSLRKFGFIRQSRAMMSSAEPPHRITHEGSSFLMEHGLL
jgi:DNA-binding CsgD family transcriptional regulator